MISTEFLPFLDAAKEHTVRLGAEVIDVVIRGDRSRRVIELFVDNADGVSLDLCRQISRSLKQEIEEKSLIAGSYRLDVSSPGIDRPLKFSWQYKKHIGRNLEITYQGDDGKRNVAGKLLSVDDKGIMVQTGKESTVLRLEFPVITESKVKSPW
ncbi:MAG: hypothetical protein WB699_18780 [Bacteroidota bacterium]